MTPPVIVASLLAVEGNVLAVVYRRRLVRIARLCKQFASNTTFRKQPGVRDVPDAEHQDRWSEAYPLQHKEAS